MERQATGTEGERVVLRTALLTLASLVAFAGNSVLCRMALLPGDSGQAAIGASAFTSLRLLSGALVLAPVLFRERATVQRGPAPWPRGAALAAPVALFIYALGFSLSYITLPAGVGALILFGTVQLVMIVFALRAGERLRPLQATGLAVALLGMVVLVRPDVPIPFLFSATGTAVARAPLDPFSVVMMAIAGAAWAAYTLLGRGAPRPIQRTAWNFMWCTPAALVLLAVAALREHDPWTPAGVALSVTSGAITSGVGYALWYTALRGHSRTSAAVVQLAVPLFAVLGGVVLLDEDLTRRIVVSALLVLGGVGAALMRSERR